MVLLTEDQETQLAWGRGGEGRGGEGRGGVRRVTNYNLAVTLKIRYSMYELIMDCPLAIFQSPPTQTTPTCAPPVVHPGPHQESLADLADLQLSDVGPHSPCTTERNEDEERRGRRAAKVAPLLIQGFI